MMNLTPFQIIGFLTDFGLKDHYVGVVKARILQSLEEFSEDARKPFVQFIDISHNVSSQNVREGALLLYFSYKYFPSGTIFLCIIDPGVGTERDILVFKTEKYLFVAPDNGLLTLIFKKEKGSLFKVNKEMFLKPPYSSTFHGRDLFAPLVAYLAITKDIRKVGTEIPLSQAKFLDFPEPEPIRVGYLIHVWHVDKFGNLITNFSKELAPTDFEVYVNNEFIPFVKTYGEGSEGQLISLWGSEGLLEIAVKNGSAYKKLGIPERILIKWKT